MPEYCVIWLAVVCVVAVPAGTAAFLTIPSRAIIAITIAAALLGAAGGCLRKGANINPGQTCVREVIRTAAACAGAPAFTGIAAAGVIATAGVSGAALLALAAVLSPQVLGWWSRQLGFPGETAMETTTDPSTRGDPAAMTDQQLYAAWRVSSVFLQRCYVATDARTTHRGPRAACRIGSRAHPSP